MEDSYHSGQDTLSIAEANPVIIRLAGTLDAKYAYFIVQEMEASAKARGTGIGRRSVESICQKMDSGDAVIAVTENEQWVGFCYVETWQDGKFVSNSGMIVSPAFRKRGVATAIKQHIFNLCRQKYPDANIFSITTGLAIMKLNSKLGFEPVTYSEITNDEQFWHKCSHCVNYSVLQSKGCKNCFCTAMLYDAQVHKQ